MIISNVTKYRLSSQIAAFALIPSIFFFWFLLTKDNYFHLDDWGFFVYYEKGFISMLNKPMSEMFIPIHGAIYFILLKLFGFSYPPFQFLVCLFHAFNAYLLYTVIRMETHDRKQALTAMILFGISSVSVDNMVWSMGINFILAGTFTFLAYMYLLRYEYTTDTRWLGFSAVLLIVAPLAHTVAILYPAAFLLSQFIREKIHIRGLIVYSITLLINLYILLLSSGSRMSGIIHQGLFNRLIGIPAYIATGIIKGVIRRIFIPDLYMLLNITRYTAPVRNIIIILMILGALYTVVRLLIDPTNRRRKITKCIRYGLLILVPYAAIAPFRQLNGTEQSTLHRYTYLSLFFVIAFLLQTVTHYRNTLSKFMVPATMYLLAVHIIASVNFNAHWQENVRIDREFAVDMKYLLGHNDSVCDVKVLGIDPFKISQVRFLSGKKTGPQFKKCILTPETISQLPTDEMSKNIYNRLITKYSTYQAPFPVPYSM